MEAFPHTELTVPQEAEGERLDRFLTRKAPGICPGLRAGRRLCGDGRVFIRGRAAQANRRLRAGESVEIFDPVPAKPAELPFLVWQGSGLAALCKPRGLATASIAGSALPSLEAMLPGLLESDGTFAPRLLNRLDNETSGLVLAALSEEGLSLWQNAEAAYGISKYYLAVCQGRMAPGSSRVIRAPLDTRGRRVTRVLEGTAPRIRHTEATSLAVLNGEKPQCMEKQPILTLVGCKIFKGARHQIRAHLASVGLPLAGDALYGSSLPGPFRLHHAGFTLGSIAPLALPDWLAELPEACGPAAERWLAERF